MEEVDVIVQHCFFPGFQERRDRGGVWERERCS